MMWVRINNGEDEISRQMYEAKPIGKISTG